MSSENLNPGAFSHATDLKNRIFFTIFLLIIYRLGTYVPLAGIDPDALKEIMASSKKGLNDYISMLKEEIKVVMAQLGLKDLSKISGDVLYDDITTKL